MTPEDELLYLRAENQPLREQLVPRDELIAQLMQRVQRLEELLAKIVTGATSRPPRIGLSGSPEACARSAGRNQTDRPTTQDRACAFRPGPMRSLPMP